MHVHRSVGQVTFVTCEMVLGAPGEASEVDQLLDDLDPETVAVDITVEDLGHLGGEDVDDPFLAAHIATVEDEIEGEVEDPVLEPYQRVVDWAEANDAELHPLGSRSSVGLVKARRIKRTATKAEAEGPEDRARAALDALMDDAQVGPLAQRRQTSLSESLTELLRREPPRMVAFFTFPWGEVISADVRRTLGLRRMEGEQLAGGWPD